MRNGLREGIVAVATIVVVVAVWIAIAPSGLGGSSTYSVTSGISMEPMIHKNDLALVRAQGQYHVGDVVLYDNQLLREPVLHRIVLIQDGDYYFRGDNNDFVDPGYATRAEIVGKLWVHVAGAGAVVAWLGAPGHTALLAGATAAVIVLAGAKRPRHRSRRRRRAHQWMSRPGMTGTVEA
jgi:signal peptidase I